MPLGAKRRKAAKLKKEKEQQSHHHQQPQGPQQPHSPTNPLHKGNGNGNTLEEHTVEPSSPEAMDSGEKPTIPENQNREQPVEEPTITEELASVVGERKDEAVSAVKFNESPPPPSEDVNVEFVQSEKDRESLEGSEIERTITIVEDVGQLQASEATSEKPNTPIGLDFQSHESKVDVPLGIGVDSLSPEGEIEVVPVSVVEVQPVVIGMDSQSHEREAEASPVTESTEPAPNTVRDEAALETEVVHNPLVERRASLFNCCGLLDVFTSSQR